MKFSPNGRHLAAVSDDGYLYIIDYSTSKLHVRFQSFYGGILCCCWSPDGKYIVTGGEDDLISVYDITSKSILARGIGHSSFVAAVTFDAVQCDNERYRIVSVGQDTRLILWDLDRIHSDEKGVDIEQKKEKKNSIISNKTEALCVAALPQNEVPYFEPVSIHRAHLEPIRDVTTFMEGIVTVCNQNIVKFWARPTHNRIDEEAVDDAKVVDNVDEFKKDEDSMHAANDLDMSADDISANDKGKVSDEE
jgi:WD40 repeat protein